MVTALEIGLVIAAFIAFFGSYRLIHTVRPFLVNTVVGLVALILAATFGFGVEITPIVLLIVAIGGLPGAALVVLLAYLRIAFVPLLF